jgi:hypothetical protein
VSVSADYIDFGQLVRLNSGTETRFEAATFPTIRGELEDLYYSTINEERPWDGATLVERAPAFDRIWLTTCAAGRVVVEEVGSLRGGPVTSPERYLAGFDSKVYLVDGTAEVDGQTVVTILDWKVLGEIPPVTIFRHIYDCEGNLLGQGDGLALGRILSFTQVGLGTEIHDVRRIPLVEPPGGHCLQLGVGFFRPDGTRVEALAPGGMALEGNMVRLPVSWRGGA